MNAIVKKHASEQELIDVAIDLHVRYPNTFFEILDDDSRLKDFDQELDLVNAERRLGSTRLKELLTSLKPWEEKHYLATIDLVAGNGIFTWQLEGADAHPTKANQAICNLDAKTLSMGDCAEAAQRNGDNPRTQ